jgi:hypothetical protein
MAGLLLAGLSDDGRLIRPVMSPADCCCCNVQSQSMLTADELVNSTIRIPAEPPVTLSALSHPAPQEPPAANASSNAVIYYTQKKKEE